MASYKTTKKEKTKTGSIKTTPKTVQVDTSKGPVKTPKGGTISEAPNKKELINRARARRGLPDIDTYNAEREAKALGADDNVSKINAPIKQEVSAEGLETQNKVEQKEGFEDIVKSTEIYQSQEKLRQEEQGLKPFGELPIYQQALAEIAGTGGASVVKSGVVGGVEAAQSVESTAKAILNSKKAMKVVHDSKVINRIMSLNSGLTQKQAENIYKASQGVKGIDLSNKAKLLKTVGVGAFGAFTTTLGIQVMQFWASVDNVAGLASIDSETVLNQAQFTDVSSEKIQEQMERINLQMEFAREGVIKAQMINPITGWAIGKFYKGVLNEVQKSINFKQQATIRAINERG